MKKNKKPQEEQYINSPLNNPMLNYKVYKMTPGENILARLVCFIIGGLVGLIFYSGLFKADGVATTATHISNAVFFVIMGILANKFLLPMYVKRRLKAQQGKVKMQFRDLLESLSSSVSSGSNVNNSFESALNDLKMQYGEDDFIVRETQEIVDGMKQNIAIEVMLRNFAERSGNEDIMNFADIFDVCYKKGGDMRMVIARTNSVISEKMAVADEIETKLTSNKMQHNVMSIMPIAVVAMLKLTNRSFAENFATPTGVIVNSLAIAIFIAAYRMGEKITDIKS